jgi:hypothetical protein
MAFLNTINLQPARKRQESLATLNKIKESIESECSAYANLALPEISAQFGRSITECPLLTQQLAEVDRQRKQPLR